VAVAAGLIRRAVLVTVASLEAAEEARDKKLLLLIAEGEDLA